jgi:hypothetical protein
MARTRFMLIDEAKKLTAVGTANIAEQLHALLRYKRRWRPGPFPYRNIYAGGNRNRGNKIGRTQKRLDYMWANKTKSPDVTHLPPHPIQRQWRHSNLHQCQIDINSSPRLSVQVPLPRSASFSDTQTLPHPAGELRCSESKR